MPCLAALALALIGVTVAGTAQADTTRAVVVSVTGASADDGLALKVSGTGFADLPQASTGAPAAGVYVALRDPATMSDAQINEDQGIVPAVSFVPSALIAGGSWSATLTAPTEKLSATADYEVIVWTAHGTITDSTLLATGAVTLTSAQHDALFPDSTGTPEPTDTSDPTDTSSSTTAPSPSGSPSSTASPSSTTVAPRPSATSTTSSSDSASGTTSKAPAKTSSAVDCTVQTVAGSAGTPQLAWGVKSSFVSYIEGGIANGSVSTSGGASRSGGSFLWGAGSGSLPSSGQGTVSFPGSVHFTGHDGALDITISGLRITTTGSGSGLLIANVSSLGLDGNRVGGQGLALADVHFSSLTAAGGTASVTLTAAGAKAFAGFYTAGESMNSLTLSVSGARSASSQPVCHNADGELVSVNGARVNTGGSATAGGGSNHAADFGLAGAGAAVLALLMVALRRRESARRGR